jgi:hypothetical protein
MLHDRNLTAVDFGGPALEGCNENPYHIREIIQMVDGKRRNPPIAPTSPASKRLKPKTATDP